MQFVFTEPQTELEKLFGGFYCINAFGKIESSDDEKFRFFIERNNIPPNCPIYINSTGGDVKAALGIGKIIHDNLFSTHIGIRTINANGSNEPIGSYNYREGKCYSAATLLFISGRLRYFSSGAQFGVHQFSYENPTPENFEASQILSAEIAEFINMMDIKPEFLKVSASTSSDEIKLLSESKLSDLNIITGGQTDVTWSVQAKRQMLYIRGERDSLYGHHKVMLGYTKPMGFFFWGLIEAQGRENELLSFGLVEITVNHEDQRIDISDRSSRFNMGCYIHVFTSLSEDEARQIAFSRDFGIQIRFSKAADMFLGISGMDTSNGSDQLTTFVNVLSS